MPFVPLWDWVIISQFHRVLQKAALVALPMQNLLLLANTLGLQIVLGGYLHTNSWLLSAMASTTLTLH